MQWPAAVKRYVIGNIYKRINPTLPNRLQSGRQPIRRSSIFQTAYNAPGKNRAIRRCNFNLNITFKIRGCGLNRIGFERPETGCREVTSNTADTETVRTIRCNSDFYHRINRKPIIPQRFSRRRADDSIFRQFNNAIVIFRKF